MSFLRFVAENRAFLLAGFLLTFTSSYGQTFIISIFAGEIMEAFSLSHGQWGGIYTLGTAASAIVMVWAGGLTDLFRVRVLAPITSVLLALSCLAMAAVTGPWMLVGVIFALRFTGQGMISHIAIVSMARWFVATRGRALSIASMGFAFGQAILPVAFVALMMLMDWRWVWVVAAGLVLASLPFVAMLLRLERTPQSIAADVQAAGMEGRHWTRSEVLRHPLFWMMVPVLLGPPAWSTALFFQQVHLTEVKGWTLAEFVSLMPLFTVTVIAATFVSGWAIDKFGSAWVTVPYMIPFAAGFIVLGATHSLGGAAVGMVMVAVGQGLQSTLPGAFWAEFFGTRYVGSIKATAAAIMVFGSAIGPGVTGVLIDWNIAFETQLYLMAAYFAASGLLAAIGVMRAATTLPAPA